MSKVIVFTNLTLDGVMQAPGRQDEDTCGGFKHGGWAAPYAAMTDAGENTRGIGTLLLGRRTYQDFFDFWPKQTGNPLTEALNNMSKYVVSKTLKESLGWNNSTRLKGDLAEKVSRQQ